MMMMMNLFVVNNMSIQKIWLNEDWQEHHCMGVGWKLFHISTPMMYLLKGMKLMEFVLFVPGTNTPTV
jgi:hypothetical protein